MHVRGQIREVLRTLLTAIPSLGGRVYFDSDEVLDDTDLPAAVVEVGDEEIAHESLGGAAGSSLERKTEVTAKILYAARADALLAAEEIAALLETAMATSAALMAIVRSSFPHAITVIRDSSGANTVVALNLSWLVTYSTNERDPTVAIP